MKKTLLKGMEREGTDLSNCRWVGSVRLKVKGIAHKYCSLAHEVFSMGNDNNFDPAVYAY